MQNAKNKLANVALILIICLFAACGGGGENNNGTTIEPNNTAHLIGNWYLPLGCAYGAETASLAISKSTLGDNIYIIFYDYWADGTQYSQFFFDVEFTETTSGADGSLYFNFQAKSDDSNGPNDLSNYGEIRYFENKLQVMLICTSGDLTNAQALIQSENGLVDVEKNRLLTEATEIRATHKQAFDENWQQIAFDLARQGLIGSSAECDAKTNLVSDYLDTLTLNYRQNQQKFRIYPFTPDWSDLAYQTLLETESIEMSDITVVTCDVTDMIETSYMTLISG